MKKETDFFAFISYSTKDTREAKRLHRRLEYFKTTSASDADKPGQRKKYRPFKPSFFAPYEIQPGGLTEELKNRLRHSRYLIVVCSPNSAASEWVKWEIEYFISLGRKDKIYLFIVDGVPNCEDSRKDCYGPFIRKSGLGGHLGANIHEKVYRLPYLNRERAYIQLITKLLDIEFDTVWQRHKRRMMMRLLYLCLSILLVAGMLVLAVTLSASYDSKVSFHTASYPSLYEGEGKLTVYLDNDSITIPVENTAVAAEVKNIPGAYRGKEIRCRFEMFGYYPLDTTVRLTPSGAAINPVRNPEIYGHIEGTIVEKRDDYPAIPFAKITVGRNECTADENGAFSLDIPLENQNSTAYDAVITSSGRKESVKLYPMRANPENTNLVILK